MQRRHHGHTRLYQTWRSDLVGCALGTHFPPLSGTIPATTSLPSTATVEGDADAEGVEVPPDDASDDASDAYSLVDDEDEPLAEMLDELQVDGDDGDDTALEDGGVPTVGFKGDAALEQSAAAKHIVRTDMPRFCDRN